MEVTISERGPTLVGGVFKIPLELLEIIFGEVLEDPVSLSVCSMVCKYWSSIARRMLFRHIHLNYDNSTPRTRRRSPQTPHPVHSRVWIPDFEGFWSMLNVNDNVASYIQVLELTGMAPLSRSSLQTAVTYLAQDMLPPWDTIDPQLLSDLLWILPSLTQLTIRQVVLQGLDFAMPYHGVLPMPHLEVLRLENVGLSKDELIPCMLDALVPQSLYIDAFHAHLDIRLGGLAHSMALSEYAETEGPEHLLDVGHGLKAVYSWALSLNSLELYFENVTQLADFVKLVVACHRLRELSINLIDSAEAVLSGRSELPSHSTTLWSNVILSRIRSEAVAIFGSVELPRTCPLQSEG